MKILDCEQTSPEWYAARMGLPTASCYDMVLATGRKGAESKTRTTYLRKLAGEIITGQPAEAYSNPHMERGKAMEAQARQSYCFVHEPESVKQVGFVLREELNTGCSPDALLGENGILEIKTQLPHLLIGTLKGDDFPPEHWAQCQGGLWVCEREWIDLVVYWPAMPMRVIRAHRDEEYIRELAGEVARFNDELAAEVTWLKSL